MDVCLDHTYVSFGSVIYQQIMGIAMGANSSVFVANLFLGYYELAFFDRLVATIELHPPTGAELTEIPPDDTRMTRRASQTQYSRGDVTILIAKHFQHTGRYIDAILSLNDPSLELLKLDNQQVHGILGMYLPSGPGHRNEWGWVGHLQVQLLIIWIWALGMTRKGKGHWKQYSTPSSMNHNLLTYTNPHCHPHTPILLSSKGLE